MLALWMVLDNVLSPAQLFMTPTDYNLPGFSVHGISQARILEQVAISFSKLLLLLLLSRFSRVRLCVTP